MPFGEDLFSNGDMSPPLIQSDLLGSVEPQLPVDQGSGDGSGPTVVTLDDRVQAGIPEADMGISTEEEVEEDSPLPGPSSTLKKRGRPSLPASATPAKSVVSRTPRSAKSAVAPKSAGRSTGKRKAAESDVVEENEAQETPVAKRGRPARAASTSTSARLAAKAAKKPVRGRPKSTTIAAANPAKKRGRPKKDASKEKESEDEYEVEDIVDSFLDADTMEHMYLVKWKNYPASANTWEPKQNFKGSLDLVRKFDAKKKKAKAAEAAKEASTKRAAAAASREEKKATRGPRAKAVKAVKKAAGRPGRKRRAKA